MFDGVSSVVSLGELGLVLEEVELLEELELDDDEEDGVDVGEGVAVTVASGFWPTTTTTAVPLSTFLP